MIRNLVAIRLKSMLAGMLAQTKHKGKKTGKGMTVFFICIYIYVAVVLAGVMCLMFSGIAAPYHDAGLGWVYFAVAGMICLAMSLLGSVFMTQNALYEAKDNDLLLSMPVPPSAILVSRMIPLLGMTFLFNALVMVPAMVMYGIYGEFSLGNVILQLLALLGVTFLSQALACLLGWGMHLLLAKMNKSMASMLYMVLFLGVYFYLYSKAGTLLTSMAGAGAAIGASVRNWAWFLYAMGRGCDGNLPLLISFLVLCALVFGGIYRILSSTFLRTATSRRSGKKRKLNMEGMKVGNAGGAIVFKEWRHFLGSPTYLTNMGVGMLMAAGLAAAGVIFRGKVLGMLGEYAALGLDVTGYIPLLICAMLAFLASMLAFSAPSVSLEGKNIWILKSMPVATADILKAKLKFHCLLATPLITLSGLVLGLTYGCGVGMSVLCGVVTGLLTVLCGVLGMVCGLRWARLDWLSEAYPVKQSMATSLTLFPLMCLPMVLGGCYVGFLQKFLAPWAFLSLCGVLILIFICILYRVMLTRGCEWWDNL